MLFFFSIPNLLGCVMAIVAFYLYSRFVLSERNIVERPFSFFAMTTLFLYRFLCLPATLLEGHPISFMMVVPEQTFPLEILLYLFIIASFVSSKGNSNRNNWFVTNLRTTGLYAPPSNGVLWALGFIGLYASIFQRSVHGIEYGDVLSKFIVGFAYLQYAPLLILFNRLTHRGDSQSERSLVYIYILLLLYLGIGSNSRQQMLYSVGTIALLWFLDAVVKKRTIRSFASFGYVLMAILAVFMLNAFSDFSDAMLYNRKIRADVTYSELIERTFDTYNDDELMTKIRNERHESFQEAEGAMVVAEKWDETYIDNFMLNRYCNVRITDATLNLANKLEWPNSIMQADYLQRLIILLPTPVINFLGIRLDKNDLSNSRGDFLYALANNQRVFASYRVTSSLADGLATFGWWYFGVQFILYWLIFKLLDSLTCVVNGVRYYSPLGLLSVFAYFGKTRNGGTGCINDASFLLRSFWQSLILYLVVMYVANIFAKSQKAKLRTVSNVQKE